MTMPGIDEDLGMSEIASHKVIEETYWNLDFTKLNGPNGDVDITGYKAAIDSGTSLIMGPNTVIQPLIEGITVNKDCSGKDDLPNITFTFDSTDYVLTPSASWASRALTFPMTSSTSSSAMSSCAPTPASS